MLCQQSGECGVIHMTFVNTSKNKTLFAQKSYSNWAKKEIDRYLAQNKGDSIDAVEEFRSMMDSFACNAKTAEANFMFSVAYDVATDVLDGLIGDQNDSHIM